MMIKRLRNYFITLRGLQQLCWKILCPLSVVSFIIAGYFLTYHLFFLELPLEDVTWKRQGVVEEKFRFDGVVYFDGFLLKEGVPLDLRYRIPRVADLVGNKKLEFFVRIDNLMEGPEDLVLGSLELTRNGKTESLVLENKTLQRFRVPWEPDSKKVNVLAVVYRSSFPEEVKSLNIATNIRNVGLLRYVLFFSLFGTGAFTIGMLKRRKTDWKMVLLILGAVSVMYMVHSGAFISNEYVPANHGKISGMVRHTGYAFSEGHFPETMYRSTGFAFLPLVTAMVEGSFQHRGLSDTFPTSRYLMFVWMALSLSYLLLVVRQQIGIGTAVVLGVLYATFHPFVWDIYSPDADAYFIPLMTVLVALFLRLCSSHGGYRTIAAMGIVIAAMLAVKVTPIFLVVIIPFALWANTIVTRKQLRDRKALVVFAVLLLSAMAGSYGAKAFQHPDRNVGKPGVPFQDHVGWHMIWAASGIYDHHTAHWFTPSNRLRRERVEEATGIPRSVQYVHQSQIATEKLYKPGVLNAFQERPGFFYSMIFLRFYNHGLTFFRYNSAYAKFLSPWIKDGFSGRENISGEKVFGLTKERELIRYGKMWKISPVVLVTKIQYGDMSRMTDMIFILMAFTGIVLLKRLDLSLFLFACGLAKFGYSSAVHIMVRYSNFCNIALLLGLSIFTASVLKVIWDFSQETKRGPENLYDQAQ